MVEKNFTNKNWAESETAVAEENGEKLKIKKRTRNRRLTGSLSIGLAVFVLCYVYQDNSVEGISGFFVSLIFAPFIFILSLDTIVRSILNIKKLDKIDWLLFILNLTPIIFVGTVIFL